ncbi:MAG: phosphorylase family protein [Planctomycetota bacterium]|jgi:adenosylhomocysteine nucleosidase
MGTSASQSVPGPDSASPADAKGSLTLILTALTVERDPIVRRLRGEVVKPPSDYAAGGAEPWPRLYGGTYKEKKWVACAVGIGPERACWVAERMIFGFKPDRVIVAGVAGALDQTLNIADILIPASVIDADNGEVYEPAIHSAGHHVLVTSATPRLTLADKQQIREQTTAHAVDMETAAIARVCKTHGLKWLCVRAISDLAEEDLPDWVMELAHPCGKPHLAVVLKRVMTQPWQLPRLLKLGRQSKAATQALALAVGKQI